MQVTPDKIQSTTWKNFYDLIFANVKSVTIKGTGGADTKTITIQNYMSQYNDKGFDAGTDYPIVIIMMPTVDMSNLTFRDTLATGNIIFEVYATQAETRDKLVQAITYQIMLNRSVLLADKITLNPGRVILDQDSGQFTRGTINVHYGKVMVGFQYDFTSW